MIGSGVFSTELVVVGLHQGLLLFLWVTRLITGAVTALGLFKHVTFFDLLLQILVDLLWSRYIRRVRVSPTSANLCSIYTAFEHLGSSESHWLLGFFLFSN